MHSQANNPSVLIWSPHNPSRLQKLPCPQIWVTRIVDERQCKLTQTREHLHVVWFMTMLAGILQNNTNQFVERRHERGPGSATNKAGVNNTYHTSTKPFDRFLPKWSFPLYAAESHCSTTFIETKNRTPLHKENTHRRITGTGNLTSKTDFAAKSRHYDQVERIEAIKMCIPDVDELHLGYQRVAVFCMNVFGAWAPTLQVQRSDPSFVFLFPARLCGFPHFVRIIAGGGSSRGSSHLKCKWAAALDLINLKRTPQSILKNDELFVHGKFISIYLSI